MHSSSFGNKLQEKAKAAGVSVEDSEVFMQFVDCLTFLGGKKKLQEKAKAAGVSVEDFEAFMQFVACFYGNMGNYLSFGDTKFVPRCAKPTVRCFDMCGFVYVCVCVCMCV